MEFAARKEAIADPTSIPEHPAALRRQGVADLLRQTRERYRQDLETVATELRIRQVYLKAIEDGRFDALPGMTYAVGFVRSYADYLGLDSKEIVRRFREEAAQVTGEPELEFPIPTAESRLPGAALLMVSLIVAAVAYGGWYYLSDRDQSVLDLVPQVPERLRALVSGEPEVVPPATENGETTETTANAEPAAESVAPPSPAIPGMAAPVDDTADSAAAGGPPAPTEQAALSTAAPVDAGIDPLALTTIESAVTIAGNGWPLPPSKPGAATAPAAAGTTANGTAAVEAPAAPPAPATGNENSAAAIAAIPAPPVGATSNNRAQTFGATNAGSRILLYARMESWIQVTDADNTPLWTRVLRAGDSYLLPNQPGLALATGNAGGLDIFVDGERAPPLGPIGVERRGILLDPDRLRAGTGAP